MRRLLLLFVLLATAPAYAFCVVHFHVHVFVDANGNGVLDPGEIGLAGATVQFDQGSPPYYTTTVVTDANGDATIDTVSVPPAQLTVLPPSAYGLTSANPVSAPLPICFGTTDVNFGVISPAPALSPWLLGLLAVTLAAITLARRTSSPRPAPV